jgi:NAD(P)-dependent dehydrogenase (short-subunit alcohol dehydrogenase family)
MHDINVRGTFFVTKTCIPHLKKSSNAHILTLSPPVSMNPKWLAGHIAYTMAKYNMSMMAMGWATEFKKDGIASNALWPKTTIDTAAVRNLLGGEILAKMSRTPAILADAAYIIFSKPAAECTGNWFIDEDVLAKEGITDLGTYSVVSGAKLYTDLFVD